METALSKAQAVAAAAEGITAENFELLVRAHQRRVYRILMSLVRDADAADTLTQECFLRAYRARSSFRGECAVETWLVHIALNLARDHARSRRASFWRRLLWGGQDERVEQKMQAVADPGASPERAVVAREGAAAVWVAVEGLSEQQRAVFVLRFAEEMTLEEISEAMDLEVGTVKAHLHRAVGTVRQKVKGKRQK